MNNYNNKKVMNDLVELIILKNGKPYEDKFDDIIENKTYKELHRDNELIVMKEVVTFKGKNTIVNLFLKTVKEELEEKIEEEKQTKKLGWF